MKEAREGGGTRPMSGTDPTPLPSPHRWGRRAVNSSVKATQNLADKGEVGTRRVDRGRGERERDEEEEREERETKKTRRETRRRRRRGSRERRRGGGGKGSEGSALILLFKEVREAVWNTTPVPSPLVSLALPVRLSGRHAAHARRERHGERRKFPSRLPPEPSLADEYHRWHAERLLRCPGAPRRREGGGGGGRRRRNHRATGHRLDAKSSPRGLAARGG
ncbi:unnamed protein product [Lampetra planeri]